MFALASHLILKPASLVFTRNRNLLGEFHHGLIECILITTICIDLTRVTAHDDTIESLQDIEKLLVFLLDIIHLSSDKTG
jgi:hypothetical protein